MAEGRLCRPEHFNPYGSPQNGTFCGRGGMRASIYNAMPTEGVEKLCDFIKAFDRAN